MKKQSLEEYLKKHGHNKTAREYGISASTLTYWKNNGATVALRPGGIEVDYPGWKKMFKKMAPSTGK